MFYNAVPSAVIILTRLRSIKSANTNVPIDRSILHEKYLSLEICHKSSIIFAAKYHVILEKQTGVRLSSRKEQS